MDTSGGVETAWAVALVSGKLALLIGVAAVTARAVLPFLLRMLARCVVIVFIVFVVGIIRNSIC